MAIVQPFSLSFVRSFVRSLTGWLFMTTPRLSPLCRRRQPCLTAGCSIRIPIAAFRLDANTSCWFAHWTDNNSLSLIQNTLQSKCPFYYSCNEARTEEISTQPNQIARRREKLRSCQLSEALKHTKHRRRLPIRRIRKNADEMAHHQMMKMYFHGGYEDQFLFQNLSIDTPLKLWSLCGVLFLLSMVYEAIKYVRCVSCGCQSSKQGSQASNGNFAGDLQDNETNVRLARSCYVGRLRSRRHRLIQALLHTVQTSIGFLLMLTVMSFNVCIIFAVVLGTYTSKRR